MRQRKRVTKSEDLCDILFLWTLNEVCLVSRFLNPKSVSEARSQWKFSNRADIAECRQWKVRQAGIWTRRGAAVLSVQKFPRHVELGGNFQQLHHGCYAIKSSWVLLLVAWWRQPVCHLGLSLEMLGRRVNDQTDNKTAFIYTQNCRMESIFFLSSYDPENQQVWFYFWTTLHFTKRIN